LNSLDAKSLSEIATAMKYRDTDDFFAALGYGAINPATVVGRLDIQDDTQVKLPEVAVAPVVSSTAAVRVAGMADLLVRFARCCSPIPGDEISGYVTRGKGVTVHRADCRSLLNEQDRDRLIQVEWEGARAQTYPISVRIETLDRPGLLSEVTNVVSEYKVNIVAASAVTQNDGTATMTVTFKVTSLQQLSKLLTRIERIRDVISVSREAR